MSTQPNSAAIFDFQAAIARLAGDQQIFRDLVEFYLADTPGLLERVRTNVAQGNWVEVERAAHTLKGMSSTFDGRRAMEAAATLERLSREGDKSQNVEPLVQRLTQEVQHLAAALRSFDPAQP